MWRDGCTLAGSPLGTRLGKRSQCVKCVHTYRYERVCRLCRQQTLFNLNFNCFMKKSELGSLKPMTADELAAVAAEQQRYQQTLCLVPVGTYELEKIGGSGKNKNDVAVYNIPYTGNDGNEYHFRGVIINDADKTVIPISNLENTTYIDERNQFVTSEGFKCSSDMEDAKVAALNATTKKFTFTIKKVKKVGGRRFMNKAFVTFV